MNIRRQRLSAILLAASLTSMVGCAVDSPDERSDLPAEIVVDYSEEMHATNKETIKGLLDHKEIPLHDIEHFGLGAIPILAELYTEADSNLKKSRIAWVFWRLGWKSPDVEKALMADLDSDDANLKVWVQWGIAKSTENSEVINKVLYNLEHDKSAFVRDKAACALASDFKHISVEQRLIILRGLVDGLANELEQVRASSIQALKIQTGQTKNFVASAAASDRAESINVWNNWLVEYERSL